MILLLGGYIVARALTLLALYVGSERHPDLSWSRLFMPSDANFYIWIADHGYPTTVSTGPGDGDPSIAFFPGYPMLVRAVAELMPGSLLATAVVVNLLIGAAVVVVGYRLATRYIDERAAFRAMLLFVCLPGGAVFSIAYADGLLVLLCMTAMLFLADERWLLAGLTGALATATRPNAVGIVVAAAVASLVVIQSRRMWSSLVAPVLMPLGTLGYFGYLWGHTGDRLAWFHVESAVWGQSLDFGRGYLGPLKHPELWHSWAWWLSESGLVLVALAAWSAYRLWCAERTWRPYVVPLAYTATVLAQLFAYSSVGFRPRFVLVAFPLCWIIARHWTPRHLYALAAVLAVTLPLLTYVYVTNVTAP